MPHKIISSKQDLHEFLAMDKKALGVTKKHPLPFVDKVWRYQIILRKYEYWTNCTNNKIMQLYYKIRHYRLGVNLGFSIPRNVFSGGLRINHYGLIVVNAEAKVGEWCDIHQGVNIGVNTEEGSVPVIGDNVYIGPGAKLFGKIYIGDNVMIGANAVVTKSFEEGCCRIAGVPAKKISDEGNYYKTDA